MNKREDKKEAILLAGMDVMKAAGYNGTSVKDIVDAAGVPKGSFYNYFESKEQFALDAIEHAGTEARNHASTLLTDTSLLPLERLTRFFESGIECATSNDYKQGCFLGNMCQEMADVSDDIRNTLDQSLNKLTRMLAKVIIEGQQNGTFKSTQDAQVIAEFLFNAWEGALMRAKAAKSCTPLQAFKSMLSPTLN